MEYIANQHHAELKRLNSLAIKAELNRKVSESVKLSDKIKYDNLFAYKQDIQDWQEARVIASDVDLPDWTAYIRVLDDVNVDSHISAIISIIKDKIKAKKFSIVNSKGDIDEDKTTIFENEWFFKFLDICIESIFYPFSFIQLGDVKDGKFNDLKLIKREYCIPQKHFIKKNLNVFGDYTTGNSGWNISDDEYKDYFIQLDSSFEFGLLDKVAYHALGKKAMLIYWWRYGEMYGVPIRHGKTDMDDPARRGNMETMLLESGSTLSFISDHNDELEIIESKSSNNSDLFKDNLQYSNAEISKVFLGSTSLTDEKSFVGSAEVGERVFEEKQKAICRYVRFIANNQLIPRMIKYGFLLNGYNYIWDSEDTMTYDDKLKTIDILAKYYDLDTDEISETTGFTVTEKTNPQKEVIKSIQKSNLSELKALYNG